MAGLPHLQGRFGARQHGHLSNCWRISDQDPCPPAPKTLEKATGNNDAIHHCSFQCPYLAFISSNKHGGQLGWTGWAAIIFLLRHHLYLLLVIFFVRSWKFYAIFAMLVIACLCCMPYIAMFAHSHGPSCLISIGESNQLTAHLQLCDLYRNLSAQDWIHIYRLSKHL